MLSEIIVAKVGCGMKRKLGKKNVDELGMFGVELLAERIINMAINKERFKERLATEFAIIPDDERQKIEQIRNNINYGFWWGERSPVLLKLNDVRNKLLRFKTLKSIHQYLKQPKVERIMVLDEILIGVEKAKQYYKNEEEKCLRKDKEKQECVERKTEEQIQALTAMYTQASKTEMLYGYNSKQCQTINQQIDEYSKNLTYQASMSLLVLVPNAMMKATAELQKDPIKAAMVAERRAFEKLNHDTERIKTIEKSFFGEAVSDYQMLYYGATISRAFPHDGQTMNIRSKLRCEIDIIKGIVALEYININGLEDLDLTDFYKLQPIITLPLNRDDIANYINHNLTTIFGVGAGQKSIDNFFNWYDEVVPKALAEKTLTDAQREKTLRYVEVYETECKIRRQLRNEKNG